jgi:type I restriction enzyme M protein
MADGKTIEGVLDFLRNSAGLEGDAQRLGQLAWMIFLKALDDRAVPGRRSPIPDEFRWRAWASNPLLKGERLLGFIDDKLFPGLQDLPGVDAFERVVRDVFLDARNHLKNGEQLGQLVDMLGGIDLGPSAPPRDVEHLYDQLLTVLDDVGGVGEHPTPRPVARFMVEQIDPKPGEIVLDPACGIGGFLLSVFEHRRGLYPGEADSGPTHRGPTIKGFEKSKLLHLLGLINLILHGVEDFTGVYRTTALNQATRDHVALRLPDIILSNPPFDGTEEEGLRRRFPAEFWTRDTADLFFYRILTFLRPGGRAAVVVPDTLLFGEGVKTRLKEKLLSECNLHTIVRLPAGAVGSQAESNANILFFTKGEPTREIWYYEHPLPEGSDRYTRAKPLRFEELAPARSWWNDREETPEAWKVSIEEIKVRNYNLDLHRIAADAGAVPWRLVSLGLHGFRGFDRLDLPLPPDGPAVLIGVNGAGKSTVLDVAAILLSSFTALAAGVGAEHADLQIREGDIKRGAEGATVSATLRIGEADQSWEMFASRSRVAVPNEQEVAQAERLRDQFLRFESASVPVLCFYPATRRLGGDSAAKARPSQRFRQLDAYDLAFSQGLGPFQRFLDWFRQEEDIENETRLHTDPDFRNPRLEVVRRAVETFLEALGASRFSDLRMERFSADSSSREARPAVLALKKDGVHLELGQLSEGERGVLLLVCDLARRFSEANPGLEDPLSGAGIVLIDDIERDLHPGWQRGFLPALSATFPRCQFIVSTHSPQVLSSIGRENVFILEGFERVLSTPHTYGRDSNSILDEVFGVPERPADMEEKIRHAADLIDRGRAPEARAALDELLSILGEHDAELVGLKTMMSFLERPVRG